MRLFGSSSRLANSRFARAASLLLAASVFLFALWFSTSTRGKADGARVESAQPVTLPQDAVDVADSAGEETSDDSISADPQIVAQQTAYARAGDAPNSSRIIRVGLATKGSDIVLWSRSQMFVSDGAQIGRRLTVPARQTVKFSLGANTTRNAGTATFNGPIQITMNLSAYGAWQKPLIWVAGGPTHVSSNGEEPRFQRAYRGSFEIAPQSFSFEPAMHKSALRLVNLVALEEYLRGVVPWEMNYSAPLEALKAQAICARSEALSKMLGGRHSKDGFEICDYDHCQGYAGTENEKPITDRATRETAGMVMYYGNEIADAVYGTNSGGISATDSDVWRGEDNEPYLQSVRDFSPNSATARVVKSRPSEADWTIYCTRNLPSWAQPSQSEIAALAERRRKSPRTAALFQENDLPEFYRWTREISPAELGAAMATKAAPGSAPMQIATEIRVLDRAASGHIKMLEILGRTSDGAQTSVKIEKDSYIRSMFSGRLGSTTALPSSTFVAIARRDSSGAVTGWSLRGAGWGHGVGMCQRGAQNHARAGWNARQIIAHYYRGTTLRKTQ